MSDLPTKKRQEYSAGGCVYRQTPDKKIEWLLGLHSGYQKWVLPKGMIESDESALETARREVLEETGIDALVVDEQPVMIDQYQFQAIYKNSTEDTSLRRVRTYQENLDELTDTESLIEVEKTVKFFLMEYQAGDVEDHDWEMKQVVWLEFDQAYQRLEFEAEKAALLESRNRLKQRLQAD